MARVADAAKAAVQGLCKGERVKWGRVSLYRRGRFYHCYFRQHGRTRRRGLGTADPRYALDLVRAIDVSLAQREPAEALHALADQAGGAPSVRVKALVTALHDNRQAAGRSPAYLRWLGWLGSIVTADCGNVPVANITRTDCESLVSKNSAMRRYLGVLFGFAVEQGMILRSPVAGIRVRSSRARLPRHLSADEIAAYRTAFAGELLEGPFLLGLYAGLRVQEIVYLDWTRVRAGGIQVAAVGDWQPKSRRARTVPVHSELATWLATHRRRAGPVCPSPRGLRWQPRNLRRASDGILDRAGLPRLAFHRLRHTFGVACAASGVPLTTIQAWLGHASITTTNIYAHYAPGYQGAGIERVAF